MEIFLQFILYTSIKAPLRLTLYVPKAFTNVAINLTQIHAVKIIFDSMQSAYTWSSILSVPSNIIFWTFSCLSWARKNLFKKTTHNILILTYFSIDMFLCSNLVHKKNTFYFREKMGQGQEINPTNACSYKQYKIKLKHPLFCREKKITSQKIVNITSA